MEYVLWRAISRNFDASIFANWSVASFGLFLVAPWVIMGCYALYFIAFKRVKYQESRALSPFLTFFFYLTDGATSGFDKRLMKMFHPSLLKDDGGSVQRGLMRAMARCLVEKFGTVTDIPRDTVVLKKDGKQVNCMALVDFERAKQVRCQLSWLRRPKVMEKYRAETGKMPRPTGKDAFVLNDIGIALPGTFYVTSFHIDPQPGDVFDVLKYVHVNDFDDYGERFVTRLLAKPPSEAVEMMVPALKGKYESEAALQSLQDSIEKVIQACGGLQGAPNDLDVEQSSCKAIYISPEEEAARAKKDGEEDGGARIPGERAEERAQAMQGPRVTSMEGIDMTYQVKGVRRNVEVYARVGFSGLKAFVARYELRILPDEKIQVVVDRDTGDTRVIE